MDEDTESVRKTPERAVPNISNAGQPSPARRRLILAAGAAIPSVYTLASGAQTAVASNLRCWAHPPSTPARFTPSDDQWLRVHIYKGTYKQETDAYCVSSPQSSCVDGSGNGQPGSIWIDSGTGNRITADYQGNKISGATLQPYGLVYVNQDGTITTLDPNGNTSLQPVADSCWTSILGGRVSTLG